NEPQSGIDFDTMRQIRRALHLKTVLRVVAFELGSKYIEMSWFQPEMLAEVGIIRCNAQPVQNVVTGAQLSAICLGIEVIEEHKDLGRASGFGVAKIVVDIEKRCDIHGQAPGDTGAVSRFKRDHRFRFEIRITQKANS